MNNKKETKKIPLVTPEIFAELIKSIVETAKRDLKQAHEIIKGGK